MDTICTRQTREVPQETREKISQKLRDRQKSSTHKENISQGLKNYWRQIPQSKQNPTTTGQVV